MSSSRLCLFIIVNYIIILLQCRIQENCHHLPPIANNWCQFIISIATNWLQLVAIKKMKKFFFVAELRFLVVFMQYEIRKLNFFLYLFF